jgi:hypothetical protein
MSLTLHSPCTSCTGESPYVALACIIMGFRILLA